MSQLNLQVRISTEVLKQIELLSQLSRSEFVRKAILEKLERERLLKLENKWITALKKNPQDEKDGALWANAEEWD